MILAVYLMVAAWVFVAAAWVWSVAFSMSYRGCDKLLGVAMACYHAAFACLLWIIPAVMQ